MPRADLEEIRRVLSLCRIEKAEAVATVKVPSSLLNFLKKRGKVSPFIREAILEKLRRLAEE